MTIRIEMFGDFRCLLEDKLVEDWKSRKAAKVLQILALNMGEWVTLDKIVTAIWPESDYESAIQGIRIAINKIRNEFSKHPRGSQEWITTGEESYRLNSCDEITCDVTEFHALLDISNRYFIEKDYESVIEPCEEALALYKSGLLPQDLYSEWLYEHRENIENRYRQALDECARSHMKQGHYESPLQLLERLYIASPYDDEAICLLMCCYFNKHRPNLALKLYQDYEARLTLENMVPSLQASTLYEEIKSGRITSEKWQFSEEALNDQTHTLTNPISDHINFAGREKEVQAIHSMWLRCQQRSGSMILIGGEGGIGKSSLVSFMSSHFEETGLMLSAGCSEFEPGIGFGSLIPTLAQYLEENRDLDDFPESALLAVQNLLPDLDLDIQKRTRLDHEQERIRLLEGLTQFFVTISQSNGPLALFIDDVQWADPSTLDFIDWLFSRLIDQSILLICTYRTEEVPGVSKLNKLITRAVRAQPAGDSLHLELEALPETQIGMMLESLPLPGDQLSALVSRIASATMGNPLHIIALLQLMNEQDWITIGSDQNWEIDNEKLSDAQDFPIPDSIYQLIEKRLDRLDEQCKELLMLMSVIGKSMDLNLLAAVWQLYLNQEVTLSSLYQAITIIEGAQFITSSSDAVAFVHDKFRRVAYDQFNPIPRALAHRYAGEYLDTHFQSKVDRPYALIAYHFENAGLIDRALEEWIPALRQEHVKYHNELGAELSAKILMLIDSQIEKMGIRAEYLQMKRELLLLRIQFMDMLGLSDLQRNAIEELIRLAHDSENQTLLAEAYLIQAKFRLDQSEFAAALEDAKKSRLIAERLQDIALLAQSLHIIGLKHWNTKEFELAKDHLEQQLKLQKRLEDNNALAENLRYLGGVWLRMHDFEIANDYLNESLKLYVQNDNLLGQAKALSSIGFLYWTQGDYEQSISVYEEVHRIATKIGDRKGAVSALGNMGHLSRALGDYERAIEYIGKSSGLLKELGNQKAYANDLNNLGIALLALGDYETAQNHFLDAQEKFLELALLKDEALAKLNLAQAHGYLGDNGKALRFCDEAIDVFEEAQDKDLHGIGLSIKGTLLHNLDELRESEETFHQAIEILTEKGNKGEMMLAYLGLSKVLQSLREDEEALRASEAAVGILEELGHSANFHLVRFNHYLMMQNQNDSAENEQREMLQSAFSSLMDLAQKITDPTSQDRFLNKINSHEKILASYVEFLANFDLSEPDCFELLRRFRWGREPICPQCGANNSSIHGNNKSTGELRHKCNACDSTFADRKGTVFESRKLPIDALFHMLLLIEKLNDQATAKDAILKIRPISTKTLPKLYEDLARALDEEAYLRPLINHIWQMLFDSE